jgi:HEAT repeat protein
LEPAKQAVLNDLDRDMRLKAIQILTNLRSMEAVPVLEKAIKSDLDGDVRNQAFQALMVIDESSALQIKKDLLKQYH